MADVVEEYVKEDATPREVVFEGPRGTRSSDSKGRKRDPEKEQELTRKRDILASVALLEGLEKHAGKLVSASDVRKMKEEDLERLFGVYEEKSGQELLRDSLSLATEGLVRGLSFFLSFDDRKALKEDLMSNRQLRRLVGRYASKVSEEYGDVVAILRLGFDIARHVVRNTDTTGDSDSDLRTRGRSGVHDGRRVGLEGGGVGGRS